MRTRATANRGSRLPVLAVALALVGLVSTGCRQDMHDQPKMEIYEHSSFFEDGSSARPIPANTVARGQRMTDLGFATGRTASGGWIADLPVDLDAALLDRGRGRYDAFCAPCHDRTGSGQGMIVLRGFKPPPSYHTDRLRTSPIGYLYEVIGNGYGTMSGYKGQIKPADRWAIAAWIRVLQSSQATVFDELAAEDRARVEAGERVSTSAAAGGHGGDEGHGE